MKEQYRNFMGSFWFQKEDNVYTVGLNEDALDTFDEITSADLPSDGELIDHDVVCGVLNTDEGPIDLYAPVSGTVIEINNAVVEDPTLIQDDPYDSWLFKIESDEDFEDEDLDEDDEDDLDEDEDEDDEEEDDEEDEDEED